MNISEAAVDVIKALGKHCKTPEDTFKVLDYVYDILKVTEKHAYKRGNTE